MILLDGSLPEAGTVVLALDILCESDVMPGHELVVTGLLYDGLSRDDLTSGDQRGHDERPIVSLAYALVPGVRNDELAAWNGELPVVATYGTDVPLPWSTGGTGPNGSGGPSGHDQPVGGARTEGHLGPWPVPAGARSLVFWLRHGPDDKPLGVLEVDLQAGAARWDAA